MIGLGNQGVDISTWVKINGAAPIEHHVYADGEVELEIGGHDGLGLHLTTEGLEMLVRVASDALTESRATGSRFSVDIGQLDAHSGDVARQRTELHVVPGEESARAPTHR